jgi:cytochrome P450
VSVRYEPFSPEWRADPYPVYRELRDREPVHFAPESGCWCVSRYDDVLFALKNPELFSSSAMFTVLLNGGQTGNPPLNWDLVRFIVRYALRVRLNPFAFPNIRNLIAADPPAHGPMRNIVNRGFTPGRVRAWEPRIRAVVDECLAAIDTGAPFDLVRDLAMPLPVTIIAAMIGVEPDRVEDFKHWSDTLLLGTTGERRGNRFHPETVKAILELNVYLRDVIRARRRRPSDDLVSALVTAEGEGTSLSTLEIILFLELLLIAGNETTTNLISNAVCALLAHPDQLARVAADPARIPAALEEALRYDPPIQLLFRTATRDVELAGTRIPAGAIVTLLLGSANRDERRFPEPDRFDVDRNPRGHLSFGFGLHFCLGASLARLEATAALAGVVPHLAGLEAAGDREMFDSFLVRGPSRLELRPRQAEAQRLAGG